MSSLPFAKCFKCKSTVWAGHHDTEPHVCLSCKPDITRKESRVVVGCRCATCAKRRHILKRLVVEISPAVEPRK